MFNFSALNGALFNKNVTDSAFRVLYLIANSLSINKKDEMTMYIDYIADHCAMSRSTVKRSIKNLEDNGIIATERCKGKGNIIRLSGVKNEPTVGSKMNESGVKFEPPYNIIKKEYKKIDYYNTTSAGKVEDPKKSEISSIELMKKVLKEQRAITPITEGQNTRDELTSTPSTEVNEKCLLLTNKSDDVVTLQTPPIEEGESSVESNNDLQPTTQKEGKNEINLSQPQSFKSADEEWAEQCETWWNSLDTPKAKAKEPSIDEKLNAIDSNDPQWAEKTFDLICPSTNSVLCNGSESTERPSNDKCISQGGRMQQGAKETPNLTNFNTSEPSTNPTYEEVGKMMARVKELKALLFKSVIVVEFDRYKSELHDIMGQLKGKMSAKAYADFKEKTVNWWKKSEQYFIPNHPERQQRMTLTENAAITNNAAMLSTAKSEEDCHKHYQRMINAVCGVSTKYGYDALELIETYCRNSMNDAKRYNGHYQRYLNNFDDYWD